MFFVVGVYWHLTIDQLPQITYVNITIAIWVADRSMRILRILRWNIKWRNGRASCNIAEVTPLEGADAVRVSVELVRPWDFKPGQHVRSTLYISLLQHGNTQLTPDILGLHLYPENWLVAVSSFFCRLGLEREVFADD